MTEIEFYKQIIPEFEYYEDIYYMFEELIESNTLQVNYDCYDTESLINDFKLQIIDAVYDYCVDVDDSIEDELSDLLVSNAGDYLSCEGDNCYYIDIKQIQTDIKDLADESNCRCELMDLNYALNKMNKNYPAKFIN